MGKKTVSMDLDQIASGWCLKTRKEEILLNEFYCVECDRFFVEEKALLEHKKGKLHKHRLKLLKEEKNFV